MQFFFRHPLVLKYDFYWRVEPGVTYYCDLTYDPFLYMQEHGKVYGFNIVQYDFRETIETLWETTKGASLRAARADSRIHRAPPGVCRQGQRVGLYFG